MQAKDVMTTDVITVGPASTVAEIAELLLKHRVSAVPVVNDSGRVIGIVSEGDLVHRLDDHGSRSSWWLRMFSGLGSPAEYIKRHGSRAEDVMTRNVLSVTPETPLGEIAHTLERRRIKRVPVVDDAGRLVGIVSRANLLRGLATAKPLPPTEPDDEAIREKVTAALLAAPGFITSRVNATVTDGVVRLWGIVHSDDEARVARIAAENVEGVRAVDVNLTRMPPYIGA